jgi:hypothetical protein
MFSVIALLLSYLGASAAIYLACSRFLGAAPPPRERLALLCIGLGPIAISRVLGLWYRVAPGQDDHVYILLCVAVFLALALFGIGSARPASVGGSSEQAAVGTRALAVVATLLLGAMLAAALTAETDLRDWAMQAYAAYATRWQPSGSWWRASLTDWGAALLATAVVCACAARMLPARQPAGMAQRVLGSSVVFVLGALCLAIAACALVLALGRPVYENDAVQYFKVATLMYERRTVAFYPLMPAVTDDGMWASSAHPLGHYGMLIWSFLIGGGTPGLGKLIGPLHGMMLALAIAALASSFGRAAAVAAALVWLSTPAVFVQTVGLGIDMPRLFILLLAVIWITEACRRPGRKAYVAAGAVLGLCIYCHALNAIAGVIAALAVFAVMRLPVRERMTGAVIVLLVALLVGGEQYLLNWWRLGSPIYDWQPLWDLVPALGYLEWRTAMLTTNDFWSRLTAGPLIGFARWYEWGLAWWAGLAGVLFAGRALWHHAVARAGLVSVAFFLAALLLYYGFHPEGGRYVLNYRYPMTVYPFIALAAGVWFGRLLEPAAMRG